MNWRPSTISEVQQIVLEDLALCDDQQIRAFQQYKVDPYLVAITRFGKLESVVVVARRGEQVIYWEDVEEGFNISSLAVDGSSTPRDKVPSGSRSMRLQN